MKNTLIIVPCYNEASRFLYEEYVSFFIKEESKGLKFLFVNDGSTDDTVDLLTKLQKEFDLVSVLDLDKNVGKAEAIRSAILETDLLHFSYVGYFDADLATPLTEIASLLKQSIREPKPEIIMGTRVKILGMTDISRKPLRHYIGRIFATIVSKMLKLPIYDTQCGAKLIKAGVAKTLFDKPFISKWLFDVELLFRLTKIQGLIEEKIIEVPVKKWEDKDGSKIKTSYFLKAPVDLLRIFFHYR